MITDEQAENAVSLIYARSEAYAKAKAARVHLEQFRKSKKALLMSEFKPGPHDRDTDKVREAYAYSHPDYIALLDGLEAAVEEEEKLKYQIEAAKLRVEIYRTQSANNRRLDRAAQ